MVARTRYAAEPLLPAAGVLSGDQADPCGKVTACLKYLGISDAGDEGARKQRSDAWDLHQPLPDFCVARTRTTAEAGVLLAILATEADLMSAYAVAEQNPQLMLWCVYPKGKGAAYGDTAIRNFLRQRGYVDSKSCAVSPELTATRYGRKG